MSEQDRRSEAEVADFFDQSVRPPAVDRGPVYPRAKRVGESFLTGLAMGAVWRKLRR